jgi:hypothetical protein
VISSKGESYTSLRGARRLVEQKLATEEAPKLIRMIEEHPRFCAAPISRPVSPRLTVIDRDLPDDYRNRYLGLPNFVRIGSGSRRSSEGKVIAA